MRNCKVENAGEPACGLGYLTKYVQIAGEGLYRCPRTENIAPPKHYKIMVIAKSPDMMDKGTLGKGRNIEKLEDLCSLATISTADIYLTGLVKCCPPRRNPSVKEIKACMGHLADELRAVDPEVVVLMGKDALRAFNLTGEGGVNSLHGQVLKLKFPHDETLTKEYNVVVTSDPNALYMNPDPRLQGTMVQDLRVAKSCVTGKLLDQNDEDTNYRLINTTADLSWLVGQIQEKGMFAFDTESRSLPWSDEPMLCIQFSWGYDEDHPTTAILPFYNHDPDGTDWKLKNHWSKAEREVVTEFLKVIFEDQNIPKVAHNIKYDMCVLKKHCGIEVKGFLFDTMLMHHLLWEHPPHDLEYLSDLELGTGDYAKELYEIVGRGKIKKKTYDHVPDEILWKYGAKDAENTYRLMCLYYPRLLEQENLWTLYQEEVHPFIRTLFRAEWHGAKLDADIIEELEQEFSSERDALLIKLKAQTWPEFNPDAHDNVAQAIRDAGFWHAIEDKRRAKGYCTDKNRLMQLAEDLPLVEDILRFRALTKLTGTYLKNAKSLTTGDGRARIGVLIHGTVNGRVSVPFLHQIPRLDHNRIAQGKHNLRDMFVAAPGYKIVYGDFSQIELVILAILSQDEEMMKIFQTGGDIHRATAAAFLGLPEDQVLDHNRGLAKSVNFSKVYGAKQGSALLKQTWKSPDGKEHPMTKALIEKGYRSVDARFPGAGQYFSRTVDEIVANGGTHTTPFGRMKHLGSTLVAGNIFTRENAERQAVNGSIQSPANSVTVRTLNGIEANILDRVKQGTMSEEDAFLILTVHDSGAWEVRDEHVDWFVPMAREVASRPVPQLNNWRFTMKIGVGNSWTEAELNAS